MGHVNHYGEPRALMEQSQSRPRRPRVVLILLSSGLLILLSLFAIQQRDRVVITNQSRNVIKIELIDGGGLRLGGDNVRLRVDVKAGDLKLANTIRDAALAAFPTGQWANFGPDASYRTIRIVCENQEIRLMSWHPLAEEDENVVAGVHGLETLNGKTRADFLRSDDQHYVAARDAFDDIERRILRAYSHSKAPN